MHESDAMEFVDAVLVGFLDRHFTTHETVSGLNAHDKQHQEIKAFLCDTSGFWVKQKALRLILAVESLEGEVCKGSITLPSVKKTMGMILDAAQSYWNEDIKSIKAARKRQVTQDILPQASIEHP